MALLIPACIRRLSTLAIASAGLLGNAVHAELTLPIDRPSFKAGDRWKYRTIDGWTNREQSTAEREFLTQEDDRLVFNVNSSATGVTRIRLTADLQPCRFMQGRESDLICEGALKFPMTTGTTQEVQKLPWPNGKGYFTEKCQTRGPESITVPAGSFDAMRVECKGYWTRVFEGSFSGRVEEMLWYAPSVKGLVKSSYTTYNSSGQVDTKQTTELVEFKPAP